MILMIKTLPPNEAYRAGALANPQFSWGDHNAHIALRNFSSSNTNKNNSAKTGLVALGALGAVTAGSVFKYGFNSVIEKVSGFTNNMSYLASAIFSIGFPIVTLNSERANLAGQGGDSDDLFARMTYTAASLGFSPQTWGDPLLMATRSPAHAAAVLVNLPHMLFTLFSYTGGRMMGFATSIKKYFNKDETREYRLEQEFNSWYTIGNLGGAHSSVVPMAGQFITGWQNIADGIRGDFGSVWQRIKDEPVSAVMGTLFNTWMWPFEYFAKYADATIRVSESAENIRGAFNKDSWLMKGLDNIRTSWHKHSSQKTTLGTFLNGAREFAKVESLFGPAVGMASVVFPSTNKFFRGEFHNEEAQEIGGAIGKVDRLFNIGAFLGHAYYTLSYVFFIRCPQFITSAIFYASKFANSLRGINLDEESKKLKENPNHKLPEGFVDPVKLRRAVFKPFDFISKRAEKLLDKLETDTNRDPDSLWLINDPENEIVDSNGEKIKGRKTSKYIRDFARVMAEENVYKPVRERLFAAINESEIIYTNFSGETQKKEVGGKVTDDLRAQILKEKREEFTQYALTQFKHVLKSTCSLSDEQIEQMVDEEYESKGAYLGNGKMNYRKKVNVKDIVMQMLDNEIEKSREKTSEEKKHIPSHIKKPKVKAKSLLELLTKPGELLEVLKLKTFHATQSILPLWIKGFTEVVDYGENTDPWWKRNVKATVTGIQEGDIKQAVDREFLPVVFLSYQNATKGYALAHKAINAMFGGRSNGGNFLAS